MYGGMNTTDPNAATGTTATPPAAPAAGVVTGRDDDVGFGEEEEEGAVGAGGRGRGRGRGRKSRREFNRPIEQWTFQHPNSKTRNGIPVPSPSGTH
jgi:hypothetical protein